MNDFMTASWALAQSPLLIFLGCVAVGLIIGFGAAVLFRRPDDN